jgi:hypothetical protein
MPSVRNAVDYSNRVEMTQRRELMLRIARRCPSKVFGAEFPVLWTACRTLQITCLRMCVYFSPGKRLFLTNIVATIWQPWASKVTIEPNEPPGHLSS